MVVFCTEDLNLVKGPASRRRRFLDLLLSQTHPTYLPLLQRYMQALRSRNALLKARDADESAVASFTRELVAAGEPIVRLRRDLLPRLSALTRLAYRRIAHDAEELRLAYEPSVEQEFAAELARQRPRERVYRSTLVGPHRDEVRLLLDERSAAQFASEGQKRSLAVALKMAQAEYLTGLHGAPPILLIDDVMGELDASRRAGLLPLLERSHEASGQVFMTCTEENWPRELGRSLQRWQISGGALHACDPQDPGSLTETLRRRPKLNRPCSDRGERGRPRPRLHGPPAVERAPTAPAQTGEPGAADAAVRAPRSNPPPADAKPVGSAPSPLPGDVRRPSGTIAPVIRSARLRLVGHVGGRPARRDRGRPTRSSARRACQS